MSKYEHIYISFLNLKTKSQNSWVVNGPFLISAIKSASSSWYIKDQFSEGLWKLTTHLSGFLFRIFFCKNF